MQQAKVELPPGELIDIWAFTRAIARAKYPSLRHAKDVSCIKGKQELLPVVEILDTRPLTPADREQLSRLLLLPGLPKLHGSMTKREVDAFIDAYRALPDRPLWEPVLYTDHEIVDNAFKRIGLQDRHRAQLQESVATGKIKAFDGDHIPSKFAGLGICISREDALDYLREHHLFPADVNKLEIGISNISAGEEDVESEYRKALASSPHGTQAPGSSANLHVAPTSVRSRGATEKRWTDELLNELKQFVLKNGKKGRQMAAEKYDISVNLVGQKLRKLNKDNEKSHRVNSGYESGRTVIRR